MERSRVFRMIKQATGGPTGIVYNKIYNADMVRNGTWDQEYFGKVIGFDRLGKQSLVLHIRLEQKYNWNSMVLCLPRINADVSTNIKEYIRLLGAKQLAKQTARDWLLTIMGKYQA